MCALDIYNADDIKCEYKLSGCYTMESMHLHDVYEIYMAMNDSIGFFVNDRVYALGRGDVMLFKNTDLHKVSVPPDTMYERYVITFAPEAMQFMSDEGYRLMECFEGMGETRSHKLGLNLAEQREFIRLAQRIRTGDAMKEFAGASRMLSLCEILLLLCRVRARSKDAMPSADRALNPRIKDIFEFIDANFMRGISLDELSAHCYLNKHYLCRLFKKETGFCIHDYIVYRRISRSMVMLRAGESVSSAASSAGFGSDTFFITTFKKYIGMTPYQYVKSRR